MHEELYCILTLLPEENSVSILLSQPKAFLAGNAMEIKGHCVLFHLSIHEPQRPWLRALAMPETLRRKKPVRHSGERKALGYIALYQALHTVTIYFQSGEVALS